MSRKYPLTTMASLDILGAVLTGLRSDSDFRRKAQIGKIYA